MENAIEVPDDDYLEKAKQKILEIIKDEKLCGYAPHICAAALNEWSCDSAIYQIRVFPTVDRRKLFEN